MNKKEKIAILQDVVRIKSVNGNETAVANYLIKLLKKNGITARKDGADPKRSNLIAEVTFGEEVSQNGKSGTGKEKSSTKSKPKTIALSGHMDTVTAGNTAEWVYPPFDATIKGDKMYGRGTTDMKSGLCAMAIAMIELKQKNPKITGTIRLLGTSGEETAETGASYLTENGYVDDINALIVGEPTGYKPMFAHKGSIDYTVTSEGKAAHSSMPKLGNNAIDHLNEFITAVNKEMAKVADKYHSKDMGKPTHAVTVIEGGSQVNSIPDHASLQGNIRSTPEFDNGKMIKKLQSIVNKLNKDRNVHLTLHIDGDMAPVHTDKHSDLIKTVKRVCTKKYDKKLKLVGATETTDTAQFVKSKNKFDFIVFGPGIDSLAHQTNEYVEINNYIEMITIYKDICIEYLS